MSLTARGGTRRVWALHCCITPSFLLSSARAPVWHLCPVYCTPPSSREVPFTGQPMGCSKHSAPQELQHMMCGSCVPPSPCPLPMCLHTASLAPVRRWKAGNPACAATAPVMNPASARSGVMGMWAAVHAQGVVTCGAEVAEVEAP